VNKTDVVKVTAPSGTDTKIKIRVAWGTWVQVFVSMDCSYTVTSTPYSPPTTVNAPSAAARLSGPGMLALSALLALLLPRPHCT
jgi:hypothetical protein